MSDPIAILVFLLGGVSGAFTGILLAWLLLPPDTLSGLVPVWVAAGLGMLIGLFAGLEVAGRVRKDWPFALSKSRVQPFTPAGIITIIGLIYATSFALPVLKDENRPGATNYGVSVFVGSFLLLVCGGGQPGWLANPALWIGLFLFGKRWWWGAALLGLIGLVLGYFEGVWANGRGDEGIVYGLAVGHYVWLSSMALLFLTGSFFWLLDLLAPAGRKRVVKP